MRIHEEYGPNLLDNPNRKSISDLGYTQAVAMLKLDVESRDNFLIVHDVDEMTIKELDTEIKKVNEIKESKEELLKQIELLQGSNKTLENELTVKVKDIESKEKEIKGFVKDIEALDKKVKKTPAKDVSAEKLSDLKTEIKLKKQRITQLENELREKPKEVETKQIMYETPEAVLKELDDLKSKLSSSENAMKFKSTFSMLMNQFNDLIGIVNSIKSDEPDEYEKYKGAVNKLLVKLAINE
jgi:chromosome segregation protein